MRYPDPTDSYFEEKFIESFFQDKRQLIETLASM